MSLDELKDSKNIVIGRKQVKKAINKALIKKVFIATDAEPHIIEPLITLCEEHKVEVVLVEEMKKLGSICGIDVGSAAVALLKE